MRRVYFSLVPMALLAVLASPPDASASVGPPEDPVPTFSHTQQEMITQNADPHVTSAVQVVAVNTATEVGMMPTYMNKASPEFAITNFAMMDRGNKGDKPDLYYMTSTTSNDLASQYGDTRSRRQPHPALPIVDSNLA